LEESYENPQIQHLFRVLQIVIVKKVQERIRNILRLMKNVSLIMIYVYNDSNDNIMIVRII